MSHKPIGKIDRQRMPMLRIATWNLRWAGPGTKSLPAILSRLDDVAADVAVLTEVNLKTTGNWPYRVDAGTSTGACEGNRRKVAVCSQFPMTLVDAVGSLDLPPANFVAVDIHLSSGTVRVIGIVIRWREKTRYLDALPDALACTVTSRTVIAGDFNQRQPNAAPLGRQLATILDDHALRVVTAGPHPELADKQPLIDHIAVSSDLSTSKPIIWPRRDSRFAGGSKDVTDHAGSAIDIDW
jgi:endonuclease/exonuclease/phosphatase family metal-dependent hydrolase